MKNDEFCIKHYEFVGSTGLWADSEKVAAGGSAIALHTVEPELAVEMVGRGASAQAMRFLAQDSSPRAAADAILALHDRWRSIAAAPGEDRWAAILTTLASYAPAGETEEEDLVSGPNQRAEEKAGGSAGAVVEEAGVTLQLWFYHGAAGSGGQRSLVTYVPPHSPDGSPPPPPLGNDGNTPGKLPSLHLRSDGRIGSRTILAANIWTSKGRNVAMITGPLGPAVASFEWVHLAVVVRKRLAQIYVNGVMAAFSTLDLESVAGIMPESFITKPHVASKAAPSGLADGLPSTFYSDVSYALGKAPERAGVGTRGARGMVERMGIYGRPLSPGEVRWLATCSGVNRGSDAPWEPLGRPHAFLVSVSQAGTTAPSGATAPVTLASHVSGYAEHVDANHRQYWQALVEPEESFGATATEEPGPEPGPNVRLGPPPRLSRRPTAAKEMQPLAFKGAIASNRSVFTREMAWAVKLNLKIDRGNSGLEEGWESAGLLDTLAAVAIE